MWNTIEGEKTYDTIELGAEGEKTDRCNFLLLTLRHAVENFFSDLDSIVRRLQT